MNFYNKYILPKLLDSAMKTKDLQKLRPEVINNASGVVLEIGFGSGLNLPYYKNITKLYALDPSRELYELAKNKIKNAPFPVEYFPASAEKIPLADNSIDSVVSTWTMCSVTNPVKVLQEIKRVLKPEGKFIFIDHGASPNRNIRMIQNILTPITKYFTGNCHFNRELEKLTKESGLTVEKIEHPLEKFKPLIYNYQGIAKKT